MLTRPRSSLLIGAAAIAVAGCSSGDNNAATAQQQPTFGDTVPAQMGGTAAGDGTAAVDDGTATDDATDDQTTTTTDGDVTAVVAPPSTVEDVIVETAADQAQLEEEENVECLAADEPTSLQDVVLAFAFDVSGSMGVDETDRTLKWEPVIAATKAFFEDQASDGLLATLTFFPSAGAGAVGGGGGGFGGGGFGGGGGGGESCQSTSYENPDVGLTPLPSTDFSTAIDGVEPNRNGTPTMPVLEGTIANVQAMAAQDTTANYVIVLVTDGVPTTCSDDQNDINNVAAVAASVAGEIPTYVIGVDTPAESADNTGDPDADGIANLHLIAEQGGTGEAFIIDTGDPVLTSQSFKEVIEQIRESAFTCNLQIPEPPDGEEFDKERVNVSYTNTVGTTELTYDPNCEDEFGWRYDNEDAPSLIEMCTNVCDAIKLDTMNEGALTVEFGCVRRVGSMR
jgi:hypothetical protein